MAVDYGQQLRIEGLHLPTAVEIHFALQETGGEAIPRVGTTKDGVTTVTIPDSMLEGNSTVWTADKAYNIYAWVYLSDKSFRRDDQAHYHAGQITPQAGSVRGTRRR